MSQVNKQAIAAAFGRAAHSYSRHDALQRQSADGLRALRAGETESPLVPLDGTLAVMRTLDTIRERIGVRYPGEDGRRDGDLVATPA